MSWFQTTIYGVDLDAEQERSNELDRRLAEQNQRALDRGAFTPEIFAVAEAQRQAGAVDVEGEVDGAFKEGLDEGYERVTTAIKDTAAAPLKFAWDIVPWQWLAAGGLALFFYMGGGAYLKGILKK